MSFDALLIFVALGLFSPGPNVILLVASGARFGFAATLPHIVGVVLGVGLVAAVADMGIGALLLASPALDWVLRIVSVIWILWLAAKLWMSKASHPGTSKERPFRFLEAVLFQWVNPKLWAIAVAAGTGFTDSGLSAFLNAVQIGAVFSSINLGVCVFWSAAGVVLTYLLKTPTAWRIFARVLALGLAASAIMVIL